MVEYVGGRLTRERLEELLPKRGFRRDAYSLSGSHAGDAMVIDHRGNRWIVFYTERGAEFDVVEHESEDAACRDLLDRLYKHDWKREAP